MSTAEELSYGKIIEEINQYVGQSKMAWPRVRDVWSKLGPFLNSTMARHGCPPNFNHEINNILSILNYPPEDKEGPFCSKVVDSYIACKDCATKDQSSACFCVECFNIEKHPGHNFRLVQKCHAVCDCGDPLSINKEGFCRKHEEGRFKELDSSHQAGMQSVMMEMQFLVFVMNKLDVVKASFTDDSKKKEYFSMGVINKLTQLTLRGYPKKCAAALFLSSKMIAMQMPDKTFLWKLTTQKKNGFIQKFSDSMLRLYSVEHMRYEVIRQIFYQLTSKQGKMDVRSPLCKVMFQYVNSQVEIVSAFRNFGPLVINNQNLTAQERQNTYSVLFYFYRLLIEKKSIQVAIPLIKDLNITRLAQYYFPRMQRSHRSLFFKMEIDYFQTMLTLLKAVIQMKQKDYLIKMIKDCFEQIKNKTTNPCFSVERTFALAFFAHVDYNVQNIIDMEQEEIMELLGEKDEQLLTNSVEVALKKSLALLKMDNVADLKRVIYCDNKLKSNHLIFSADHIYLKILFYLLMRLQTRNYDISEPLSSYITARVRSIDILLAMWKDQEISKLEETIEMYFYEFASVTSHIVYLCETSIYQLIATCSLNPNSIRKQSAFEFLQFITYIFEPAHMRDLRARAFSYIKNEQIIEQFVKTAYQKYKDTVAQGIIPKNNFNISYSSFYLQFKGFKEASSMYELKLRNYRRTRLSGCIFNQEIMDRLYDLFKYMFDVFIRYFKNTQVINAKLIMGSAVECSIVLALETKDSRFDELALRFEEQYQLTNKLPSANNSSVYYRELISMYRQSQTQLTLEKSKALSKANQIEPSKKIRENAAMRIKKLNELKQKQKTVLANNKECLDSMHTVQLKQGMHSCTVCKNTSIREELFYICSMRFSNLVKTTNYNPEKKRTKPNSPILVISTCGHAVHLSCLKRTIAIPELDDSYLFDFQCFLCKATSNTIFPIASQHHPLTEAFDRYKALLTTIIPELMCEYPNISQNNNVEGLRNPDLLLNSLAETIYYYAIQFPKYLVMKLLPIIREEVRFLRAYDVRTDLAQLIAHFQETAKKMNTKSYGDEGVLWVKIALLEITNNKKTLLEVRQKIDMSFALPESHSAASERIAMILNELTSQQPKGSLQLISKYDLKDNYDVLTPLPHDLVTFNALIGKCPTCKKVTSKIRVCIVCGFKTCKDCTQALFNHVQMHLDSTGFIIVQNGVCLLFFDKDQLVGNHLYLNYAGEFIPDSKLFPKEGEYTLSMENRNYLFQILLNDGIRGEILQRGLHHSPCQFQ